MSAHRMLEGGMVQDVFFSFQEQIQEALCLAYKHRVYQHQKDIWHSNTALLTNRNHSQQDFCLSTTNARSLMPCMWNTCPRSSVVWMVDPRGCANIEIDAGCLVANRDKRAHASFLLLSTTRGRVAWVILFEDSCEAETACCSFTNRVILFQSYMLC